MLASQKTLDLLKSIGMNKYERNLWVSLLYKGTATAGELADMSQVPRSRCYDVLETLSTKGFIVVQHEKPLKYRAIDPEEAVNRVEKKIQDDTQIALKRLESIKRTESIRELEKLYKESAKNINPAEIIGTLKGRNSHSRHAESLYKKAKKEIKIVVTEKSLDSLVDRHHNHLKKIAKAGVKIKVLTNKKSNSGEASTKLSKFADIRNIDDKGDYKNFNTKFSIVDGKEFLLSLTEDDTHPDHEVVFWSQSDHASKNMMEPLFDGMWKNSKRHK